MNILLKAELRTRIHLLLLSTTLFSFIFFNSCKQKNEQTLTPDAIEADSSVISALIVNCRSSDIANSGFAIVDVQQNFLNKKLIKSTYNGQLFSVSATNEGVYKAILDKLIVDFQTPEAYFQKYETFSSIIEEKFNSQVGFKKTEKLNLSQLDQLFKRQGVLLPSSETFTLKNFQGLITISARVTDRASNYGILSPFFKDEPSRSTSQTKDDLVIFKSFIGSRSGGYSYSYPYPLPPSPSPIFDAPVWYWHQYTLNPSGATLIYVPPGAGLTQPTGGSNSTGQSTGDPHITTTDNFYYDFQGHGEFIAVKSTEDNFEVQVRQEDIWNSKVATVNTAIGIQTRTDIVSITAKPFTIYVNNKPQILGTAGLPLSGNASISKTSDNGTDLYTIKTVSNDLIRVSVIGSDHLDYSISLNSNRKGKVTGLLGNFDGDRTNDLQIRGGKVIEYSFDNLYPTFTDSWRIDAQSDYARLLYYESGKDTKSYTLKGFPATPTFLAAQKLKDAESTCLNAGVTKEPYLSNCIYDVAVTNDVSFTKSALWNQQNNPATGIPYGSDLSEIKNIQVIMSNDPINQNDSCLLSLSTGKVFRVKDGAQHASEIDVVFRYAGYNDELYAYKAATAASLSHQGPLLNRELLSQNWSIYKNTALESLGFARDDNPSDNNRVDATLWNYIKTTVDLRNSFYSAPSLLKNTDRFDETSVVTGDASNKSILMNKTLRRFVTQDGKLGVIRFTNWGKSQTAPNSWWVTMDIKVQK